ncbi:hypothetical protein K431DRAFT_292968 [Polychaeton citri CBS 116435]|uniref:Nudix hydrolase domain-containing protein n=1 Tax=Polychaeton citri CBS 116435 TaxID=1314669 RepID=A0A9P4QAP7_9PEZI|nr:hypothetical protein K431DRAFT_292968 [Polychaeton citri CBS 116435]
MAEPKLSQYPKAAFTFHPSAAPFNMPQQTYLSRNPDDRYSYIATGALVFDTSVPNAPRVLLLQRSASDSMSSQWEIPGGGCDDDDKSILHAAARELWEEARLKATWIGKPTGDMQLFSSRSGKKICKFNFLIKAEMDAEGKLAVSLDPTEHQQYVWACKDDVKARKVGQVPLQFTSSELENIVLNSFAHVNEYDET